MKYDEIVDIMGEHGYLDFAALIQLSGESRPSLRTQLHRWVKAGKLVSLRRGMYALPERYRKRPLSPAEVANALYMPSYLSLHWALGYYGMLPEYVPQLTSVTRRKPAQFDNVFGIFVYRCIKSRAFFGFRTVDIGGARVRIAEPEKALLDLWYLSEGRWDKPRMEEMRFQNPEMVSPDRLEAYAERIGSPRVTATVRLWLAVMQKEEEGVEL